MPAPRRIPHVLRETSRVRVDRQVQVAVERAPGGVLAEPRIRVPRLRHGCAAAGGPGKLVRLEPADHQARGIVVPVAAALAGELGGPVGRVAPVADHLDFGVGVGFGVASVSGGGS